MNPWEQPNEHGELPGDICCQRATGARCFEHDPRNYQKEERTMIQSEVAGSLELKLVITDLDSLSELTQRAEGRERTEYALGALRIGLLSLRHARGQVDADSVRREGEKLLHGLNTELETYRTRMNESLTIALSQYFDPQSGKFTERVDRLIKRDGELEMVLNRQIGLKDSQLVSVLTTHLGVNSPLMRILDPKEAAGTVQMIRKSVEDTLQAERAIVLSEFSLNKKDSALSRFLSEMVDANGKFKESFARTVTDLESQFSLDKKDSALSRLVNKVEVAQQTITKEFSLDDTDSSLSRLRRELVGILEKTEERAQIFQVQMTAALESMKARKEESYRSAAHGAVFEDLVVAFVQNEAQNSGDIAQSTGTTTGEIRYCKVGDAVIELGEESAAAGAKIVVEAKEDASYDLNKARAEIETGRKNRAANVGVFVFSKKTAPTLASPINRYGNDVIVVWDNDDPASDIMLKSALSLAKALCVRGSKVKESHAVDFQAMDDAMLELEREANRLDKMKTWTETIQVNSGKALEEIRKMTENLGKHIVTLKESISNLKRVNGGS